MFQEIVHEHCADDAACCWCWAWVDPSATSNSWVINTTTVKLDCYSIVSSWLTLQLIYTLCLLPNHFNMTCCQWRHKTPRGTRHVTSLPTAFDLSHAPSTVDLTSILWVAPLVARWEETSQVITTQTERCCVLASRKSANQRVISFHLHLTTSSRWSWLVPSTNDWWSNTVAAQLYPCIP